MKIVIDIPKDVNSRLCFGVTYPKDIQIVCEALQNGTPLPKGHGDLIDVSNLLTVTDIREDGTESTYVPYEEIEDALTIIEADKEEE